MSTPQDPQGSAQDPTAGILADLESLRATRTKDTPAEAPASEHEVTPDVLSTLDSIAEAAESLRHPEDHEDDLDRADDTVDEADDDEHADPSDGSDDEDSAAGEAAPAASARGAGAVFSHTDEVAPAPAAPTFSVANPFSFGTAFSAPTEAPAFTPAPVPAGGGLLFQAPQPELATPVDPDWDDEDEDSEDRDAAPADRSTGRNDDRDTRRAGDGEDDEDRTARGDEDTDDRDEQDDQPRRRRRGGRGRRSKSRDQQESNDDSAKDEGAREDGKSDTGSKRSSKTEQSARTDDGAQNDTSNDDERDDDGDREDDNEGSSRRRRRTRSRSRSGDRADRSDRSERPTSADEVTGVKGSTRLEAKRQRRREGREAGRRRTIITEAEFLARRESVERKMIVRELDGRTQLGVLEDGILVEHYLSEAKAHASLIGNVYLGKVQNVLPSMEAAFIDIGKGRNAVLYAGEVNWDALGMEGKPRRIELALKPGDSVLVQVTKDPIGHKGARLTSQISLPGRFLVYVPGNSMTGISRKLPDVERARLKRVLKELVPADAGVIVRTAAEGVSETELGRDVDLLSKRWESITKKAEAPKTLAPQLLYSEPDMTVRIIRDVFNEDFSALVIDGDKVWETIHEYVESVAPDLLDRVSRYEGDEDIFEHFRVSEQIEKALDRKVNLPSGGSLVIDRTEAMTVIDVNTGKFTGSGGNLEETVTKNNLEAAEEVIRQLRLRDIGGIIVIDFIDMVLESNRDLVVRRLVECLGRDRTKHQVAEVTSLGLVQMTRKRIGTGLAESLVQAGEDLSGRGLLLPGTEPEPEKVQLKSRRKNKRDKNRSETPAPAEEPAVDPVKEAEEAKKAEEARAALAAVASAAKKAHEDEESATAADVAVQNGDDRGDGAPAPEAPESEGRSRRSRSRRSRKKTEDAAEAPAASQTPAG
ncbi:Rne/Rng family ribonuclease, partial [Brevibacterium samyangense]